MSDSARTPESTPRPDTRKARAKQQEEAEITDATLIAGINVPNEWYEAAEQPERDVVDKLNNAERLKPKQVRFWNEFATACTQFWEGELDLDDLLAITVDQPTQDDDNGGADDEDEVDDQADDDDDEPPRQTRRVRIKRQARRTKRDSSDDDDTSEDESYDRRRRELPRNTMRYSGASSDNLIEWLTAMELAFEQVSKWSDKRKVLAAYNQLDGHAASWFRTIWGDPEKKTRVQTWPRLRKAMLKDFQSAEACKLAWRELKRLVYQRGKTMEFIQEFRRLAQCCKSEASESVLIEELISKIACEKTRVDLATGKAATLEDAFVILLQVERARTAYTPHSSSTANQQPPPRRYGLPARNRRGPLRCFRCQEVGHVIRDCPKPPPRQPRRFNHMDGAGQTPDHDEPTIDAYTPDEQSGKESCL